MTAPAEFHDNCNMCQDQKRQEEAVAGLRCMSCLESFDKPYPFQSESSPELCNGCARQALAPKFPGRGYDPMPVQKRGTT